MIKVNLLKDRGSTVTDMGIEDITFGNTTKEVHPAAKMLTLILPILGIYFYEFQNINELKAVAVRKSAMAKQTQSEVVNLRATKGAEARKLQAKRTALKNKVAILKQLSKIRMRELKAFDKIQNIIPDKVWISNLNYKLDKLKIQGQSLADIDVNNFVKSMEKEPHFSDVILRKSTDKKTKLGLVKSFEITCNMENVN